MREEVSKQQIEIAAEARLSANAELLEVRQTLFSLSITQRQREQEILEAKATGYQSLVSSAGGDAKAAATLLMVEKIEEIVARQTEAIANLKIDKITVWDSGSGSEGGSTANFVITHQVATTGS